MASFSNEMTKRLRWKAYVANYLTCNKENQRVWHDSFKAILYKSTDFHGGNSSSLLISTNSIFTLGNLKNNYSKIIYTESSSMEYFAPFYVWIKEMIKSSLRGKIYIWRREGRECGGDHSRILPEKLLEK